MDEYIGTLKSKSSIKKTLIFKKIRVSGFYEITKLYGIQTIEIEFVFNKDDKIDIPKKINVYQDTLTRKWYADTIEKY